MRPVSRRAGRCAPAAPDRHRAVTAPRRPQSLQVRSPREQPEPGPVYPRRFRRPRRTPRTLPAIPEVRPTTRAPRRSQPAPEPPAIPTTSGARRTTAETSSDEPAPPPPLGDMTATHDEADAHTVPGRATPVPDRGPRCDGGNRGQQSSAADSAPGSLSAVGTPPGSRGLPDVSPVCPDGPVVPARPCRRDSAPQRSQPHSQAAHRLRASVFPTRPPPCCTQHRVLPIL